MSPNTDPARRIASLILSCSDDRDTRIATVFEILSMSYRIGLKQGQRQARG